jgi:hypothetical protein
VIVKKLLFKIDHIVFSHSIEIPGDRSQTTLPFSRRAEMGTQAVPNGTALIPVTPDWYEANQSASVPPML